jgi:hypothetical protein
MDFGATGISFSEIVKRIKRVIIVGKTLVVDQAIAIDHPESMW